MSVGSGYPVLVLNADFRPLSYFPLSLWSWQEAVKAVVSDRVNVVSEYEREIRSPSSRMRLPSVISLKEYVPAPNRPAFTRFNVFLRDHFTCQYCGQDFATHDLTFDHVIPRALGGRTTWGNVVAACSPCNVKKGHKLVAQAGMRLLNWPKEPRNFQLQENGRSFPPISCINPGVISCIGIRNWISFSAALTLGRTMLAFLCLVGTHHG